MYLCICNCVVKHSCFASGRFYHGMKYSCTLNVIDYRTTYQLVLEIRTHQIFPHHAPSYIDIHCLCCVYESLSSNSQSCFGTKQISVICDTVRPSSIKGISLPSGSTPVSSCFAHYHISTASNLTQTALQLPRSGLICSKAPSQWAPRAFNVAL